MGKSVTKDKGLNRPRRLQDRQPTAAIASKHHRRFFSNIKTVWRYPQSDAPQPHVKKHPPHPTPPFSVLVSAAGLISGEGVGETGSRSLLPDNNNKRESGFTIVEVMIVLAIAGLVLAIVFIAVPALQRNSRNTQRRSDLANLRAQVDTWVSNNGGKIPSTQDHLDSIVGSTGWGHYNGNGAEPAAVAQVTAGTIGTSTNETITMFTDTVTNANMDASALPNRQAIHIWLEEKVS